MRVLRHNRVIAEYTPKRPTGSRAPSDTGPRILEAIRAAERRGEVLSVRQLVSECGISSTSVVLYWLRQMAEDGDLTLGARGASRAYKLTEQGRGLPDDATLLRRCLDYLEREMGATGGALLDDLRERLS